MESIKKSALTSNPVYSENLSNKKEDLLEVYKIRNSSDAMMHMPDRYNKFKLVCDTLLQKGPIFIIKHNGKQMISLGPDLNMTMGTKEVLRRFKGEENEKTVLVPYAFADCQRFLVYLSKNYTDKDFNEYIKDLKETRDDFNKPFSAAGSREYIDATNTVGSPSLSTETIEKIPPFILKEIKETEEKLKSLKKMVDLYSNLTLQNKEKIEELQKTIDFTNPEEGADGANFHRSTSEEASFLVTGPSTESTFYKTAPDDDIKKCTDCNCTENECCSEDEEESWVDGKCLCCK